MISKEFNKKDAFAQLMQRSKLELRSTVLEDNIMSKIYLENLYRKKIRKNIKISILFSVSGILLGISTNIFFTSMDFNKEDIFHQIAIILFQTALVLLFILLTENLIKFFKSSKDISAA